MHVETAGTNQEWLSAAPGTTVKRMGLPNYLADEHDPNMLNSRMQQASQARLDGSIGLWFDKQDFSVV